MKPVTPQTSRFAMIIGVVALSASSGCGKKTEKNGAASGTPSAVSTTTAASRVAATIPAADEPRPNCHGTMSGGPSATFKCEGNLVFFVPPYKDSTLSGNTELSLVSSRAFPRFELPENLDIITWTGVLRGPLKVGGTYTEKDLIQRTRVSASVVSTNNPLQQFTNVKRLKFTVKSIAPGDVRDDTALKLGKIRTDKVTGDLELVFEGFRGELALRVTYD